MKPELNKVHCARIAVAARAARSGARILFRVNPGDPPMLVWVNTGARGTQHVIAQVPSEKRETWELWRAAAVAKFEELICPAAA